MKKGIIIYFICLANLAFGQDLKTDLKGKWFCNKIIDSLGLETEGKYGESGKYLQFSFDKLNLIVIQAPFDKGLKMSFDLSKTDSILDLFPNAVYNVPERKYKVKYLKNNYLALQTTNLSNQKIYYIFTKQLTNLRDSTTIDCGAINIVHIIFNKKQKLTNRTSEYLIKNSKELNIPTPYFDDEFDNFGYYFSFKFSFPENYEVGNTSDELIVEFDVSKGGAKNVTIINVRNNCF